MSETSARFALPFILPGQAQKEAFHNEALARIDAALHPAVESAAIADPPATPDPGEAWIVASPATGAWAGKENEIASWTDAGWRFIGPSDGMTAWDKDHALLLRWDGSGWSAGAAISVPSGGAVIDAEARGALAAVIAALMSHGLIE